MRSAAAKAIQNKNVDGHDSISYANKLLGDLDITNIDPSTQLSACAVDRWHRSGLSALTGCATEALKQCPVPVASYADGVLNAFQALLEYTRPALPYTGAELLTLRAKMTGLSRRGNISAGGSCRILPTADGILALNLPREDDWGSLNAWLQSDVEHAWPVIEKLVAQRSCAELLDRGRLLGLAVADAEPVIATETSWFDRVHSASPASAPRARMRVIDLSSLWAGPLCGRLLQWAGAEVIKVEGRQRPDGARAGSGEFFSFLNAGKQQLQLALDTDRGREELRRLIHSADIVIEGSRPRALRQMGIHAEQLIDETPGLTWIGLSGYGRTDPEANWIAYGDDAGVAAGLSSVIHSATGRWMFCGDAIADPLTGIHAALAALASWKAGGGDLLSLSLVQTVEHCIAFSRGRCEG